MPGRIPGIDVRRKDGRLYALTSANTVVTVDLAGGAAFSADAIRAIRKTPLRDLAALPIKGRFAGD